MPTNQQRRDNERQRLQRQLEERRAREIARRRTTLIASIIGTLVIIAAVVTIVVVSSGGSGKNKSAERDTITSPPTPASTAAATTTPASPAATVPNPTAPCARAAGGATAAFKGLTVGQATNVKVEPKLAGKLTADPSTVICQDLVIGRGKAAAPSASVSAQYVGAVARTGKVFQSSWGSGQKPTFTLTSGPQGVIAGFAQGIGGAGKIAPMRVGGRRIIVMPAAAGYGANPPPGSNIPPNATLVFIVDLVAVNG